MTGGADEARAFAHWWVATAGRADLPPTAHRQPLMLAGDGACVGTVEPALAARMAAAGLPLREQAPGWALLGEPDDAFAVLAGWLHRHGLSNGWRNELLDVCDEAGRCRARVERSVVRPLGVATQAVHLIALDGAGGMWVQQRALDKPTDPGLWDTTMGGLRAAGETAAAALWRETWEEAGLRPAQVRSLAHQPLCTVRRPLPHGFMVEHIASAECVLAEGAVPVNQDGEVARFECWDRATLVRELMAGAFTLEAAMVLGRWLSAQRHLAFSWPAPSAGSR